MPALELDDGTVLAVGCEIHPLNKLPVLNFLSGSLGLPREAVDAWISHWTLDGGLDAVEALLPGDQLYFGSTPTPADCLLTPQLYNAGRFNM